MMLTFEGFPAIGQLRSSNRIHHALEKKEIRLYVCLPCLIINTAMPNTRLRFSLLRAAWRTKYVRFPWQEAYSVLLEPYDWFVLFDFYQCLRTMR